MERSATTPGQSAVPGGPQLERGYALRRSSDYAGSLEQFRASAALGNGQAMWELGRAYSTGLLCLHKDNVAAVEMYRKSAELGYPGGMAHYAFYLKYGRGAIDKDLDTASVWAVQASVWCGSAGGREGGKKEGRREEGGSKGVSEGVSE